MACTNPDFCHSRPCFNDDFGHDQQCDRSRHGNSRSRGTSRSICSHGTGSRGNRTDLDTYMQNCRPIFHSTGNHITLHSRAHGPTQMDPSGRHEALVFVFNLLNEFIQFCIAICRSIPHECDCNSACDTECDCNREYRFPSAGFSLGTEHHT